MATKKAECAHCRSTGDEHARACAIARKCGLRRETPIPPAPYIGAVVQYHIVPTGAVAAAIVVAIGDEGPDLRVLGSSPVEDSGALEVGYGADPGQWSWAPQVWSPR